MMVNLLTPAPAGVAPLRCTMTSRSTPPKANEAFQQMQAQSNPSGLPLFLYRFWVHADDAKLARELECRALDRIAATNYFVATYNGNRIRARCDGATAPMMSVLP